jgi:hypothetical protein
VQDPQAAPFHITTNWKGEKTMDNLETAHNKLLKAIKEAGPPPKLVPAELLRDFAMSMLEHNQRAEEKLRCLEEELQLIKEEGLQN